jgi:hypothetical protein
MGGIRPVIIGPNAPPPTFDPLPISKGGAISVDPINAEFLGLPPDPRYVFGKQTMPDEGQILRGVLGGLFDPMHTDPFGTQKKIQNEIQEHNNKVMERAELLTYYDQVLGYKIPPRIEVSGMGGKVAKVALPIATRIEIPEIPSLYLFYPTSGLRPPEMSGWSNDQIVAFAMDSGPNGYAHYLNSGGEPVDIVDDVVKKMRNNPNPHINDKAKAVDSIKNKMKPRQDKIEEEKAEFDEADLSADEATRRQQEMDAEINEFLAEYEEEIANLPAGTAPEDVQLTLGDYSDIEEFMKEYESEIDDLTKWKIFNSMTKGMGYSVRSGNNVKSAIYKQKGGKQWVENYIKKNGAPKTPEDTERMRDAWNKKYPTLPSGTTIDNLPSIDPTAIGPSGDEDEHKHDETKPTDPSEPSETKPTDPSEPKPTEPPEKLLTQREHMVTQLMRAGMTLEQAMKTYDYVTENNKTFSMDPDKPGDVNWNKGTGTIQGIPDDFKPSKDDPVMTITYGPIGQPIATATRDPERDPDGHGGEEEKKPPKETKKTATSSPEDDPDFSRTTIDTQPKETDPDKRRKEPPIPPIVPEGPDQPPPDQPRRPKKDDDDDDDDNKPMVEDDTAVGYKRPEYFVGGQDVLRTTEKEKLEEITNWDLFDLPIPDSADLTNPLYMKNLERDTHRYYQLKYPNTNNIDNILKSEDGGFNQMRYGRPIKKVYHEPARYMSMLPHMRPVDVKTAFQDPYDRRIYNSFSDAYRSSESESGEILNRSSNIYPDMARLYTPLKEYRAPESGIQPRVNMIDLLLSEK